jgi:hypothetical protein
MKRIPDFKTLEEAADFWDTHDFEDYVGDTVPVEVAVRSTRRKKTLTIPVELSVYAKIEALASRRRVRVETLVSRWLKEKVLAEGKP